MIQVTIRSDRGEVVFTLSDVAGEWIGTTVTGTNRAVLGRDENAPLDDVLNLAQADRWGLSL